MNILWLSHLLPFPPKGGVYQRSYNLIKELSKHHQVYMLCFTQRAQQPTAQDREEAIAGLSQIATIVNIHEIQSDVEDLGRAKLALRYLLSAVPATVGWLNKPGLGSEINQVIDELGIDLVHFDTISWACYHKEIKAECITSLNHHNIESHMMLRRAKKEWHPLKKLYFYIEGIKLKHYEKKLCPRFDANLTCSDTDTERLISETNTQNTITIPNGVDLDYFTPSGITQKKRSLIFAGGLSWYPNISALKFFLTHVWPKLIKILPDVTFTIVGRNPPQWLIEYASADQRVIVTGFVEDVRPYIEAAAVYVCPINDGGGTKLKVLDAFSMAKAMVAHPIACEGINVKENIHVLFAKTADQYIEKIMAIFDNDELRLELGDNARRLIEDEYNFEVIGKNLSSLYTSMITKSKGH